MSDFQQKLIGILNFKQEKSQSEDTRQASEPDSDTTLIFGMIGQGV